MKYFKKIVYLISILTIIFTPVYSSQHYESNIDNPSDLEFYYFNKMTEAYIYGYDVDINGKLKMSQYQFEKSIKEITKMMLSDGFNFQQVERIKNKSRKIGQEARNSWDILRKSLKEESNRNQ